jgi:hypothetical protein
MAVIPFPLKDYYWHYTLYWYLFGIRFRTDGGLDEFTSIEDMSFDLKMRIKLSALRKIPFVTFKYAIDYGKKEN